MNVELLDHQPNALELLIYTKNTRLQGNESLESILAWPMERKLEELEYIFTTIQSSWEFVRYTFLITGVSRAFTHQLVRTRHGSYAQESQRAVDMRGASFLIPVSADKEWEDDMAHAMGAYSMAMDRGMPPQDARGLLPTNVHTSIIAAFTLRGLHDMGLTRLCTRTQGEYQDVFREMKARVVSIHPWTERFIRVACAQTGVCIFPRYTECPIQPLTYNGARPGAHKAKLEDIAVVAETVRHEAVVRAKGGRT